MKRSKENVLFVAGVTDNEIALSRLGFATKKVTKKTRNIKIEKVIYIGLDLSDGQIFCRCDGNGLMLKACLKNSEMISLSKGRKEKMG